MAICIELDRSIFSVVLSVLEGFVHSMQYIESNLHLGVWTERSATVKTMGHRLTILLVVFFCNPFYRELDVLVRDVMAVKQIFQELQGFGSKGMAILSEYLKSRQHLLSCLIP